MKKTFFLEYGVTYVSLFTPFADLGAQADKQCLLPTAPGIIYCLRETSDVGARNRIWVSNMIYTTDQLSSSQICHYNAEDEDAPLLLSPFT